MPGLVSGLGEQQDSATTACPRPHGRRIDLPDKRVTNATGSNILYSKPASKATRSPIAGLLS
jgi:hypothetical protein